MPTVSMPKLSDTMTEGVLVKWIVGDGEQVEVSQVIAEVETDKATMEMEAFDDGTLKHYVAEGTKVPIGEAIAFIAGEGEEAPAAPPAATASTPAAESTPQSAPAQQVTGSQAAAAPEAPASAGPIKASPLAAKMATARGIALSAVAGTGPGGRIIKRDILAFTPSTSAPQSIPAAAPSAADQRISLTGMRATIAERLLASKTQIPHFYLHIEVDAAPLLTLRKQVNVTTAESSTDANKYTINDFILAAAVTAAVTVPQVNSSFAGDAIIQYGSVNLSVAVAVDDGLVTPVIRDAHSLSLLQISRAVKDLAERARNKRLSPNEFAGGTLTVSNLGAYGIDAFDAIINPPQAAILSIGALVAKPVVDAGGEITSGQRIDVGLSCDHRVVDGAIGAAYLAEFKRLIENPAIMLV